MTDQAIMVASCGKAADSRTADGRARRTLRAAHAPRPTGEPTIAVTAGGDPQLPKAEARREYMREWRRAHKEKYAEYQRKYYEKHKAEHLAYQRKYRAEKKREDEARRVRREIEGECMGIPRPSREEMRMLRCGRTVSLETITRARVKPEGVSDARWRMELSRRRMAAKEKSGGGNGNLASLPDPDRLW